MAGNLISLHWNYVPFLLIPNQFNLLVKPVKLHRIQFDYCLLHLWLFLILNRLNPQTYTSMRHSFHYKWAEASSDNQRNIFLIFVVELLSSCSPLLWVIRF